jgi:hypothetical protein
MQDYGFCKYVTTNISELRPAVRADASDCRDVAATSEQRARPRHLSARRIFEDSTPWNRGRRTRLRVHASWRPRLRLPPSRRPDRPVWLPDRSSYGGSRSWFLPKWSPRFSGSSLYGNSSHRKANAARFFRPGGLRRCMGERAGYAKWTPPFWFVWKVGSVPRPSAAIRAVV